MGASMGSGEGAEGTNYPPTCAVSICKYLNTLPIFAVVLKVDTENNTDRLSMSGNDKDRLRVADNYKNRLSMSNNDKR